MLGKKEKTKERNKVRLMKMGKQKTNNEEKREGYLRQKKEGKKEGKSNGRLGNFLGSTSSQVLVQASKANTRQDGTAGREGGERKAGVEIGMQERKEREGGREKMNKIKVVRILFVVGTYHNYFYS